MKTSLITGGLFKETLNYLAVNTGAIKAVGGSKKAIARNILRWQAKVGIAPDPTIAKEVGISTKSIYFKRLEAECRANLLKQLGVEPKPEPKKPEQLEFTQQINDAILGLSTPCKSVKLLVDFK